MSIRLRGSTVRVDFFGKASDLPVLEKGALDALNGAQFFGGELE
jgi:hypothetical protein